MLNENHQELKYIVKVNGKARTSPLIRESALIAVQNLPLDERPLAELVLVTDSGQELLLEN